MEYSIESLVVPLFILGVVLVTILLMVYVALNIYGFLLLLARAQSEQGADRAFYERRVKIVRTATVVLGLVGIVLGFLTIAIGQLTE
jgi:hypothetical protein